MKTLVIPTVFLIDTEKKLIVDIFVGFCVFSLESVQMISHILKKRLKFCKYPTNFLNLDAQKSNFISLYSLLISYSFSFLFGLIFWHKQKNYDNPT